MTTDDHKDAAANSCSVILRGMGDVQLPAVINFVDYHNGMWDTLNARYAALSTFNNTSIQKALSDIRYGWQSMEASISEYEQLAAQLDTIKAPLYDYFLITISFQSFADENRGSYAAVITSLQTQEAITWVQAAGRMLQEYKSQVVDLDSRPNEETIGEEKSLAVDEKII